MNVKGVDERRLVGVELQKLVLLLPSPRSCSPRVYF